MRISVERNGIEEEVSKSQLYEMASRGEISRETEIKVDGKVYKAGSVKGMVFGKIPLHLQEVTIHPVTTLMPQKDKDIIQRNKRVIFSCMYFFSVAGLALIFTIFSWYTFGTISTNKKIRLLDRDYVMHKKMSESMKIILENDKEDYERRLSVYNAEQIGKRGAEENLEKFMPESQRRERRAARAVEESAKASLNASVSGFSEGPDSTKYDESRIRYNQYIEELNQMEKERISLISSYVASLPVRIINNIFVSFFFITVLLLSITTLTLHKYTQG